MDLRKEEITLGELWDDKRARAVLGRHIPGLGKHPIQRRARAVTLGEMADLLEAWLPAARVRAVVKELEAL